MASSSVWHPAREILGRRVLDLVVADAVFAGHEDHPGGRDPRYVTGVVARAAHDVQVRKAARGGGIAYCRDAAFVEGGGREVPDLLQVELKSGCVCYRGADLSQSGVHSGQRRLFRVAEVDGEEYPSGDGVPGVRGDLQHADRRAGVGLMVEADSVDRVHHA